MKKNRRNGKVSQVIKHSGYTSNELISLIIILVCITALTFFSIEVLKRKFQQDIEHALNNVLEITIEGFHHEKNKRLKGVQLYADSAELIVNTETLLAHQTNTSAPAYQQALSELRHYFSQDLTEQRYLSFYIIGPENINIASADNNELGKPNALVKQPKLLKKLWSGELTLTPLEHTDLTLKNSKGQPHRSISDVVTMFVGAPIRNEHQEVIALLTLSINPYRRLFPLLERDHVGDNGETYAFDKNGLMLSRSQFEKELIEQGLMEKISTDDHAIRLYDPGVNLFKHPELSDDIKPVLTKMAASATKGEHGSDSVGYRDYRGIKVVGAWHWFPEADMGIATEQDVSDAYSTFYYVRIKVLTISGVICLLIIILYAITAIKRKKITASKAYLNAIYKTSIDALIIINQQGIIQQFNPTTEQLFGYKSTELIGKDVRLLIPGSHWDQFDGNIQNESKAGEVSPEKMVIGTIQEFEAIKSDGTVFPIELNVNPLDVSDEKLFAGSIRDISQRKQAQQQAHDNEKQLINTLKHAHIGIWSWDAKTRVISYTGHTAYIYGLEEEEKLAMCSRPSTDFIQCVHPDDREVVKNLVYTSNESDNKFDIEYRVIWPNGEIHWANARGDAIFNPQGRVTHTTGIVQDITQQKELEQELRDSEHALRESENHLSNILNTAPANIYIKNLEGKYIFVNPAWKDAVSLSERDVLGKTDSELFGSNVAEAHKNIQQMVIENKQNITFEENLTTKSGEKKSFMTSIFPLENTQGESYALGGWSTDITGLKKTQYDLEKAKLEADASNKAKSVFLATMSHEIRTPMNGVIGIVDVLSHTSLNHDQEKLVNTINDSSFALLGIIDDILDFSKIDAGKMELEDIAISIHEILEGVGETLLPLAAKKGIELITYCDPGLSEFYGDPIRLRQILYNISGNAIKFTHSSEDNPGRVTIRCEKPYISNDSNTLIISVQDTGIGMSTAVQEKLFNPFSQAESSITREFGGTGLGLTISKRLIELMNGDITVKSEEGVGTLFTVSLPLIPARENSNSQENNLNEIATILFKGDDVVDEILQQYLNSSGISVYHHSSEVLNQLIDKHKNNPLPLVAIIVNTQENTDYIDNIQVRVREQYGDKTQLSFMIINQKLRHKAPPLANDTLLLDMNNLTRTSLLLNISVAAGFIDPELLTEKESANDEIDFSLSTEDAAAKGTLFLVAEDNPVNQRVLNHQLSILGYPAEIANDGQEALELWKRGREKYNLLLTDCHMPHMDGYNLAREIRNLEGDTTSPLPIIAITADAMKGTRKKCLDAGMNDYLTKPLQVDALSSTLAKWVSTNHSSKSEQPTSNRQQTMDAEEIAGGETPVSTADELTIGVEGTVNTSSTDEKDAYESDTDNSEVDEAAVIDPTSLPELLQSDDPSLLTEFYHDFLNSAEEIIKEITQASSQDDLKKVSSESHKLKSSSYTVGANKLGDCCLLLETLGKQGENEMIKDNTVSLTTLLKQTEEWIVEHFPNN